MPGDADAFVAWDLRFLAHDSLLGRRTGEPGSFLARRYILAAFQEAGLARPPEGFVQPFQFSSRRDTTRVFEGANVVGWIPGTNPEAGAIVFTAHFDHVGVRQPRRQPEPGAAVDSIYNGADDNASGTVAIMSMARYFAEHPLKHTAVFAAVDAEEMGLRGARAFVEKGWPEDIVLNVNLDMVSRSDSLLFIVGTYHYPHLRPILEPVQGRGPVVLRFGHDEPDVEGMDDWTWSSDQGAFQAQGIQWVYFGVEDHDDYHRPTDEFERIDPTFFLNAIRTVFAGVLALDEGLVGREPPPG